MLKILIKKQLSEQYAGLFYNQKKNKTRSRLETAAMILLTLVLGLGAFGVMLTLLSLVLCESLVNAGLGWLYFTMMGLIALLMGVLGGAFGAYTHLYKSKDNDTLLSLPIPTKDILTSRILSVFLPTGGMTLLCLLPAMIVYWIFFGFSAIKLLKGLLFILCVALLALVLGCLLGYVVARISTKMKNKSFITVLVSLLMMGLYYFFYFRFQKVLQKMNTDPEEFQRLEKIPGLKFFGQAGEGQWLPLLVLTLITLLLAALTVFLLIRSFRKIISAADSVARVKVREGKTEQKAPFRALLGKELTRLSTNSGYMLNGALGSVLLVLLAGALLIKGPELRDQLLTGMGSELLVMLLAAGIGFMAGTNTLTAPSVSLEGKQLWILKSLPVEPFSILKAKLGLELVVTCIPALLASLAGVLVLKPKPVPALLMILYPQLVILFFASLGLMLGLLRPNLTWTNEMVPIKQSISVTITMLGGMFYGVVLVGLYFLVGQKLGPIWVLAIACVITALLAGLIWMWLKGKGVRKWEEL